MAKDIQYDPSVLQKLANQLYAQARAIVRLYGFIGLLLGGVGGFFGGTMYSDESAAMIAAGLAIVGLAIGVSQGRIKAASLLVQAQTLLCQVRIEENTRGAE